MDPAKLKRTTPPEMFEIVRDFVTARPGALRGEETSPQRFFVVPSYRAILRADPDAVRNFFSYMSLGDSRKAKILKPLLQAACRSRLVLGVAIKAGFVHDVLSSERYPGVRWSAVDALVAEWQFVACFSLSEQFVAHCLSYPKYIRCLRNEVDGRNEAAHVMRVPEVKQVHLSWPAGYTESIVVGDKKGEWGGELFHQIQARVLELYERSSTEVKLRDYLDSLASISSERYEEGSEVVGRILVLVDALKEMAGSRGDESIQLARCHGDLSPGQVLVENGEPYLIDWSESEMVSVTYDLAYTAVFYAGWRDFTRAIDIPELETLRRGLRTTLRRFDPALLVGLMLAEMGACQYVDYGEKRGTIKGWTKTVDYFLDVCHPEEASPTVAL